MNIQSKNNYILITFLFIFLFLGCESSSDIYTLKVISINDSIHGDSYYKKNEGSSIQFSQGLGSENIAAYEIDFRNLDEIEVKAITTSPNARALHIILLENGKMVSEARIGQTSTTAMSKIFNYP